MMAHTHPINASTFPVAIPSKANDYEKNICINLETLGISDERWQFD